MESMRTQLDRRGRLGPLWKTFPHTLKGAVVYVLLLCVFLQVLNTVDFSSVRTLRDVFTMLKLKLPPVISVHLYVALEMF